MTLATALNLFFPPHCPQCSEMVDRHKTLCQACWQAVTFITDPCCECCGMPFDFHQGEQVRCGACLQQPPVFSRARAAVKYDAASQKLVLNLKYHDQLQLAASVTGWMQLAARELLLEADVLVPVPLHYRRYVRRRYNQSALLAGMLANGNRLPHLPQALKRIRHTPSQTGLSRKEREKNVRSAFNVREADVPNLKGKNVLLVDDVYTTGATLNSCAKALLRGGVRQVSAVTLARSCVE